ncbi:MAG: hypothetical protein ACI9HK_002970 [Pirellulaceae bacterium]
MQSSSKIPIPFFFSAVSATSAFSTDYEFPGTSGRLFLNAEKKKRKEERRREKKREEERRREKKREEELVD